MWTVTKWDETTGQGTITGPHLGPLPFSDAGPFAVGEEVLARLDESEAGQWRVLSVTPVRGHQPEGSRRAEFDGINALRLWDWRLLGLRDGILTIVGSNDFAYSHEAEVTFHDVSFVSCPAFFSHALFRGASDHERSQFPDQRDWEGTLFCVVTEHGNGPDGPRYFVCAERVECTKGTVYYYQRENLKPGERVAPWVEPESD